LVSIKELYYDARPTKSQDWQTVFQSFEEPAASMFTAEHSSSLKTKVPSSLLRPTVIYRRTERHNRESRNVNTFKTSTAQHLFTYIIHRVCPSITLCIPILILIIKPTRCTNFSNLFLESNSTCFGQFLCPSSGV